MSGYRSMLVRTAIGSVLAFGALVVLVTTVLSVETKTIKMRDNCDPATFNAVVGPGTCVGNGDTTFTEFLDEVNRHQMAPAWRFNPLSLALVEGKMLLLQNLGGETHTFTKVEDFGGGFVAELNAPSGNPTPRPECAMVLADGTLAPQPETPSNIFVEAGTTENGPFAGSSILPVGETKFQCCIHPWMHITVRVPSGS